MTDHEHHHLLSYADGVAGFRAQKDEYFRFRRRQPAPRADRPAFAGLPYFDVDEA